MIMVAQVIKASVVIAHLAVSCNRRQIPRYFVGLFLGMMELMELLLISQLVYGSSQTS
jgi:hypothetical protein